MHRDKPLVLFFPFSLLSHYLRCIELAEAIKEDCTVLFAGSPAYNGYIARHGFGIFDCANYDAREMIACASRFDFSWINEQSIERIFLDQVRCIEALRPDYVIGDGINTLKMAAGFTGVPYWSMINGYMTMYYAQVRDVPSAHPAAKYSKHLPIKVYSAIIRFAEQLAFRKVHKPFKKLRNKYKLKEYATLPLEMEGDLNFILDLPELFPQKMLPSNYFHLGPVYYTGRDPRTEIEPRPGKPIILVSMGSSGSWQNMKLLSDPVFRSYHIITAGDDERVVNGPHISSCAFVSGNALWSRADLVICHGGNGTVYQALSYGIPVLCWPFLFEQEYNVKRIEQLRLGADISRIQDAATLRQVIEQWIGHKHSGCVASFSQKINVADSKKNFGRMVRKQLTGVRTHSSSACP
jgi:UDP:flavonoid glycosyltransferase YjiC (YdhE family)